ncbi:MAG: DUF6377 domain-containing protein [Muribaculum sp.]|nr:DUF6377 domain-containing protein [Muribaculum sp.]
MQKLLLLLSAILMSVFIAKGEPVSSITKGEASKALKQLDLELKKRDIYLKLRESRIDSVEQRLCQTPVGTTEWFHLIEAKGDLYDGYLTDSALICYEKGRAEAIAVGDHDIETRLTLKSAVCKTLTGFVGDGVNLYESVDYGTLSPPQKELALECGRQLYSYVGAFYSSYPEESGRWISKATELQEQLLELLDKNSQKYLLNLGEYMFMLGNHRQAKAVLLELLESVPPDSNIAARAANIVSQASETDNLYYEQIYYLAISAIADLKSASREAVSLQQLGLRLYEIGDIERSHEYLAQALHNAVECHAAMRMLQTSKALPVIDKAHQQAIRLGRNRLYIAIIFLVLLTICLGAIFPILLKEMKRTKVLQAKLENANNLKAMYMSHFLNLCTIYMNKLNLFCQISIRKISTGHSDELLRLLKSGKLIGEHSQEFYDNFDRAFLHIHPDFVEDVNKLLLPDQQIVLKDGEMLNTDLRILAFIRLGIDNSSTIAQALNFSVHTIYAYRNRIRNQAIDRENFDNDIMKIN